MRQGGAGAGDGDRLEGAALHVRAHGAQRQDHAVHLTAEGVGDGRRGPVVRHRRHVDAGLHVDHLHAQVAAGAGAGRALDYVPVRSRAGGTVAAILSRAERMTIAEMVDAYLPALLRSQEWAPGVLRG